MDELLQNSEQCVRERYKTHIARCARKLKSMNAPLSGWKCDEIIDIRKQGTGAEFGTCDICGYRKMRYLHVMSNPDFPERLLCSCICAGVLEGDVLKAETEENDFKNKAARKVAFMQREWKQVRPCVYEKTYQGQSIFADRCPDGTYMVKIGQSPRITKYKGNKIVDLLTANLVVLEYLERENENG